MEPDRQAGEQHGGQQQGGQRDQPGPARRARLVDGPHRRPGVAVRRVLRSLLRGLSVLGDLGGRDGLGGLGGRGVLGCGVLSVLGADHRRRDHVVGLGRGLGSLGLGGLRLGGLGLGGLGLLGLLGLRPRRLLRRTVAGRLVAGRGVTACRVLGLLGLLGRLEPLGLVASGVRPVGQAGHARPAGRWLVRLGRAAAGRWHFPDPLECRGAGRPATPCRPRPGRAR
ncbi:hypothetical protein F0L68_06575 [Solihabitans fulvus]|uniref:Uncharacterized protein n=1 Tax=Solihabitans fulvus TaxID=1892852 RepID=A0A5B2XLK4_9PSEU|nr:hypothetical protein F0L68_06575 [Solihabitans fulvus]